MFAGRIEAVLLFRHTGTSSSRHSTFGASSLVDRPSPLTSATAAAWTHDLPKVVEALPYAVAVAGGPEGRILAANAAWIRLAGAQDRAACLGQSLDAMFPQAGRL